ncbi:uncharacterized protein LOC119733680 [Patiria miniata]|uniref:Uncharacterized protein n=1 Tax=Patiria miniata TaxID=46514 RepID=A0A914AHY7_PATMI|nr:uncharacterized protein LOC119733680 [Patiria miniata]
MMWEGTPWSGKVLDIDEDELFDADDETPLAFYKSGKVGCASSKAAPNSQMENDISIIRCAATTAQVTPASGTPTACSPQIASTPEGALSSLTPCSLKTACSPMTALSSQTAAVPPVPMASGTPTAFSSQNATVPQVPLASSTSTACSPQNAAVPPVTFSSSTPCSLKSACSPRSVLSSEIASLPHTSSWLLMCPPLRPHSVSRLRPEASFTAPMLSQQPMSCDNFFCEKVVFSTCTTCLCLLCYDHFLLSDVYHQFATLNISNARRSVEDETMTPQLLYSSGPPKISHGKYDDLKSLFTDSAIVEMT